MTYIYLSQMEELHSRPETSMKVVRAMMNLIIPLNGFPIIVGSDNEPTFMGQVTQHLSKALGLIWKLHTACQSQKLGQLERQNGL